MLLTAVIILIILLVYKLITKPLQYWKEKGVPHEAPWPLVGNFAQHVLQRKSFMENLNDLYKAAGDNRYFGYYQFTQKNLLIKDLDLIKSITIKEFDTFPDHRNFIALETDPLLGKSLLNLKRENGWQDMRATLSPTFTSSKMKVMYSLMDKCAEQFVQHYIKQDDFIEIELKESLTRVANDVIASTAFGVECNSLENKENEFYRKERSLTEITGYKFFLFLLSDTFPNVVKFLNIRTISVTASAFFANLVKETIDLRKKLNVVRPDLINILMEAQNHRSNEDNHPEVIDSGFAVVQESEHGKPHKEIKASLKADDIAAQATLFFFAGFDTVSTTLCQILYDIAIHTDVQDKLRAEVEENLENNEGKINYEVLQTMKYLDCVISEGMRLRPAGVFVDRKCVKPFTIEPKLPGETAVRLEKGDVVIVPVWSIQRDPRYYQNPEKFDPERFNDENKHLIKPFTYLPFGSGPRGCIGSRFALLEMKLIVVKLIQYFEITPTAKTCIPMKLGTKNFSSLPDEGLWIGLKKLKN